MKALYIGLMSGTSADGVDAVLVEIDHNDHFKLVDTLAVNYSPDFRQRLLHLALADQIQRTEIGSISYLLSQQFADACNKLLQRNKLEPHKISAIGSHGHTIDHAPNSNTPYSVQIGDHSLIAEKTGITTIADFRSRDIAAGGQGAPLVPAFHQWLFRQAPKHSAILNIGGISNITVLKKDHSEGYDCSPGNCLIDSWHQQNTGESFDSEGQYARKGTLIPALLNSMLSDSFFHHPPPKSTGREHFNLSWLQKHLTALDSDFSWQDVARTLVELTAVLNIETSQREACQQIYLCGGGSHNQFLVERMSLLAKEIDISINNTQALGLDVDWVEASAFAWLAHQTLSGLPGNLPTATGAKGSRILGAIYPA